MMGKIIPQETITKMIADYKHGLSTEQLAKKYDISSSSAFRLMKKAGVLRSRSEGQLFANDGWMKLSAHLHAGEHEITRGLTVSGVLLSKAGLNPDPKKQIWGKWQVIGKRKMELVLKQD